MPDLTLTAAQERAIRHALMDLPKVCQYHGSDFDRTVVTLYGLPRCESCRIPFRAKAAWDAYTAAIDHRDDRPARQEPGRDIPDPWAEPLPSTWVEELPLDTGQGNRDTDGERRNVLVKCCPECKAWTSAVEMPGMYQHLTVGHAPGCTYTDPIPTEITCPATEAKRQGTTPCGVPDTWCGARGGTARCGGCTDMVRPAASEGTEADRG